MAERQYYPESELVQKLQTGEYGWLQFVNHHSKEWKDEYLAYCKANKLVMNDESAERFVNDKGEMLEKALAEGEA